jgi:hypothetical protein
MYSGEQIQSAHNLDFDTRAGVVRPQNEAALLQSSHPPKQLNAIHQRQYNNGKLVKIRK